LLPQVRKIRSGLPKDRSQQKPRPAPTPAYAAPNITPLAQPPYPAAPMPAPQMHPAYMAPPPPVYSQPPPPVYSTPPPVAIPLDGQLAPGVVVAPAMPYPAPAPPAPAPMPVAATAAPMPVPPAAAPPAATHPTPAVDVGQPQPVTAAEAPAAPASAADVATALEREALDLRTKAAESQQHAGTYGQATALLQKAEGKLHGAIRVGGPAAGAQQRACLHVCRAWVPHTLFCAGWA
jgi:hypothetical protein